MTLQVVTIDVIQVYLLGGSTVRQTPLGTVVYLKHLSVDTPRTYMHISPWTNFSVLIHPLSKLILANNNYSA